MANPHQQKEQHIAAFFVQKLTKVHSQVASTLAASQERYNTIQDRHHIGQHHQKGKPLLYGPYTILEHMNYNAYRLDGN